MASGITVDSRQLRRVTIELRGVQNQIPGAMASALNRTLDFTATHTTKLVTQEYAVKAKDVKATMRKKKASKSDLSCYINSTGHTISLMHFKVTPRKYSKRRYKAKVQIKKSGGKQEIKGAFVQTMNGATNVWKREGRRRLPVRMLRTLSIPQMISNEKVDEKVSRLAGEKLNERIQHEIDFRLQRAQNAMRR